MKKKDLIKELTIAVSNGQDMVMVRHGFSMIPITTYTCGGEGFFASPYYKPMTPSQILEILKENLEPDSVEIEIYMADRLISVERVERIGCGIHKSLGYPVIVSSQNSKELKEQER